MHFSIPDTREIRDACGSPYVAYNIHINGTFHCIVRYRQLHNLHDQLKREYGPGALPSFPPKKLLPLTPLQTEERRAHLEKYIQLVSQDGKIVNGEVFNGFLLSAQQETLNASEEELDLDVYLMNWQKISVQVFSNDPTSQVLEAVGRALNLPSDLVFYFCIYLVFKEDSEISIIRRMEDFEAPCLSLRSAGNGHYLAIRKGYWDSSYDEEVVDDRIALNLVYVQAVSDVEHGWVITNKENARQLVALQARGSKKEYLQLARTLKYYGYIQFSPCTCDYPQPNTPVLVSVGGKELNFRLQISEDQMKEIIFRVTRIRCWRITTSGQDNCANGNCTNNGIKLELSFEYLINKDKLQWIAVCSPQAILMSVCLQGMVEELLMKRNGCKLTQQRRVERGIQSQSHLRRGSWSYMKRDGSSHQICIGRSFSTDGIANSLSQKDESKSKHKKDPTRRSTEKLSSSVVSSKPSSTKGTSRALVENDAFDGIGDDDL